MDTASLAITPWPPETAHDLLKVKDLHVRFAAPGTGLLGMNRQWLTAVNGVR